MRYLKFKYHSIMWRINAFLFGEYSTNAHKHYSFLAVASFHKGFRKGFKKVGK